MDSVSFAHLPRINAEDVSYIAVASRIAETNARLDLMNSLRSENTARCLQNEKRVQYLARQKNNHASYSNVVTGSDNSSQLHQASSNVSESRPSASKFRLGGLTHAPPSGPFKMPKPPSIAPLFPPGHIPLSSLLSKNSSSTSRATKVDAGDPQSGTTRPSDGANLPCVVALKVMSAMYPNMSQATTTLTDMTIPTTMVSTMNRVLLVFMVLPPHMAALTTFTAYPARCHWMQVVDTKIKRNGNVSPITVPRLMAHSVVADDSMVLPQVTRFLEHLTPIDTFSYLA